MRRLTILTLLLLVPASLLLPTGEARTATEGPEGVTAILGEVRWIAGNVVPSGWALCEGQLIQISSNTALFSLLGTTYGGDGVSTFALPDLRGRSPLHKGSGPGLTPRVLGERGGAAAVSLAASQLPTHTHTLRGVDDPATVNDPEGNVLANTNTFKVYAMDAGDVDMHPLAVADAGGNQPHENRQPYLGLRAIIAMVGIFPSPHLIGSDPVVGEIRWFAFNFAPQGWASCDGQLLLVDQNMALFSLLGTTYGGNGSLTFGLPDLRGRVPLHEGAGPGLTARSVGASGGQERVSLTLNQMPAHNHAYLASDLPGDSTDPTDRLAARGKGYAPPPTLVDMAATALSNTGGGQPHENMAPFVTLNACIALVGIYPPDGGNSLDGFLSEVRWTGWAANVTPAGYAECDGQLLLINSNLDLFSLLGTIYGGDGRTTFGLPDLRGRVPVHPDAEVSLGEKDGAESVALALSQMPIHSHRARASSGLAQTVFPAGAIHATTVNVLAYKPGAPVMRGMIVDPMTVELDPSTVGNAGGGQPHDNVQPFLALRAFVALSGTMP